MLPQVRGSQGGVSLRVLLLLPLPQVEKISHHKAAETSAPKHYTIKDDAVYSIVVKELIKGQWVPFDGKDMQMEFVRIDPFVRVTMENKKGVMTAKFKVPDTYGVYQFKVNYNRIGLTRIATADQVSLAGSHPCYSSTARSL